MIHPTEVPIGENRIYSDAPGILLSRNCRRRSRRIDRMKKILAIPAFIACLTAQAQHVKITDPNVIRLDPQVHRSKAAIAGMQAAGISSEQEDLVIQYSDPALWPPGLRTDSARKTSEPYIQKYMAFVVCNYQDDSTLMSILMVPARENIHMPEEMRPIADLYLVVPATATEEVLPPKPRPVISRGPRWKDLPVATITKPDDLYATYDLADDKEGMEALRLAGMSEPEIGAVVFRSHERNWPEGIDQFDERYPRLLEFKKYKCYRAASWADKVLLIVPVEKNRKLPVLMRPYVDIYFIYSKDAVVVKEKKRR